MIMVGNKSDLEYERAVSEQEGVTLAQQLKVGGLWKGTEGRGWEGWGWEGECVRRWRG